MKKLAKVLALMALSAVVCLGVFAFAACGGNGETYDGEYKYANAWDATKSYGVKVHVSVKDGKITKVTYDADAEDGSYVNVSPTWKENARPGELGADKTKAAIDNYLKETFVGKTVTEVLALEVAVTDKGEPSVTNADKEAWSAYVLTGATQTSGRFVLAIQNALKDVK